MEVEDDVRLIEALRGLGILPGNLASIIATALFVFGLGWAADNWVADLKSAQDAQMALVQKQIALISQMQTRDEEEMHKIDAARQNGDAEIARTLRQINSRIDNFLDGHHGQLIVPPGLGDITRDG